MSTIWYKRDVCYISSSDPLVNSCPARHAGLSAVMLQYTKEDSETPVPLTVNRSTVLAASGSKSARGSLYLCLRYLLRIET